jgi:epsilon-lactone hydrolase
MSNLHYTVKPVDELRADIEAAASQWPLAAGTILTETICANVPAVWIDVPAAHSDGPVYLHTHGGGYYRGSARVDAAFCSHLCDTATTRCLSINYRRPPDEGVFPAALDDFYRVWRWLIAADGGDVAPNRVVIGGTSAGGGLALALLLKLRDEGSRLPAGAALVSPWTDLTQSGASFSTNATHGPDRNYLEYWAAIYLDGADPQTPYASPLFGDLCGLPPLFIQVGGHETMLDDSTALAAKAARAGCSVNLEVYAGQPHSFQHEAATKEIARDAVRRLGEFVRERTRER